jgi:epoxyqueuosine reductase
MVLDVTQAIREQALALGFDAIGFAPAELDDRLRADLTAFLAAGWHGDMGWLAAKVERRGAPRRLWPESRTVIALGVGYAPGGGQRAAVGQGDRGAISVYAQGRDYHDVVKARLKRLAGWLHRLTRAEVKVFVDTAPVMEKPLAVRAGLGWQGKHTNLVSRRFGSWLFLGEIYTTLELPADDPGLDRCGRCRRCLDACPTRAFPAPYRLDARRCISYLTIEHHGPIDPELRPLMGNRIYGCDDCLAVCPWNRFARAGQEAAFLPRAELTAPWLAELAQLTDGTFRTVFAGSPIKRIGRNRFVRNVLIALGNSRDRRLAPVAAALTTDPDPVVAESAVWAVERLSGPSLTAAPAP